jgi:septum site-determining protein MinD
MLVASVSSSKGGSGKSTTSINLGVALNDLGKDVCVVDANLSTPYLSMYLGAPNVPVTLHHVLKGEAKIHDAIYQHASGTKVIPGSLSMHDIGRCKLEELGRHIHKIGSDVVILDGAPGLDAEAQAAIKISDEVMVVTTPELPSVASSLKTIRMAQQFNKPITGVVLTRAGHDLDLKIKNIQTILEHPVIGVVPEDHHIKKALVKREPVVYSYPESPSSQAYRKLAAYLTGLEEFQRIPYHNIIRPERPVNMSRFLNWAFGKR